MEINDNAIALFEALFLLASYANESCAGIYSSAADLRISEPASVGRCCLGHFLSATQLSRGRGAARGIGNRAGWGSLGDGGKRASGMKTRPEVRMARNGEKGFSAASRQRELQWLADMGQCNSETVPIPARWLSVTPAAFWAPSWSQSRLAIVAGNWRHSLRNRGRESEKWQQRRRSRHEALHWPATSPTPSQACQGLAGQRSDSDWGDPLAGGYSANAISGRQGRRHRGVAAGDGSGSGQPTSEQL